MIKSRNKTTGKSKKGINTTIYFDEETLKKAKHYCVDNRITMTKFVNQLVLNFLEEDEREDEILNKLIDEGMKEEGTVPEEKIFEKLKRVQEGGC